jgi:hypothetical protein
MTNFGSPSPNVFTHIIHCNNHFIFEISKVLHRLISFTVENLKSTIQIKCFVTYQKKKWSWHSDVVDFVSDNLFHLMKVRRIWYFEMRRQTRSFWPPVQTQFPTWVRHTHPWILIVCIGGAPGFCGKLFWISQFNS